jgi:hypothetical protein
MLRHWKSITIVGLLISIVLGFTIYESNLKSIKSSNIAFLESDFSECEKFYNKDSTHFGGQGNKFYPCLLAAVKVKHDLVTWEDKMSVISKKEKSRKILGFCHDLMHEIAIEYYTEIDVNKKLPSLCGDGFLHGVMQTAAKKGDDQKLAKLVEFSCSLPKGGYDPLCIHGVGHVYWEQLLDLKYYIDKCSVSVPGVKAEKDTNILLCQDGFLMKGAKLIKRYSEKVVPGALFGMNALWLEKDEANSLLENCDTYENNVKFACKAVFWRWYSPYFIYGKNTPDFEYIKSLCGEIIYDKKVLDFCGKSIGTVAFNYMTYIDKFDAKVLDLFCTSSMMPNCVDGVFEQYSEFPKIYDNNSNGSLLNFVDFTNKFCEDLGKDPTNGREYLTDCTYVKDRRMELRVSG